MTKKNAKKLAARARQEAHGGKYQNHLQAVGGGGGTEKPVGFFKAISNAIRDAHPEAKLDFVHVRIPTNSNADSGPTRAGVPATRTPIGAKRRLGELMFSVQAVSV